MQSGRSGIFYLAVSDIVEPTPGQVLPDAAHLDQLLGFVHVWDRTAPMLIHCFAGVSRSTAAAYIAACALKPERDEFAIARALRAASPTASPNTRLVALADDKLGRRGRMSEAIAAIGRGEDCFEGEPFTLELQLTAVPIGLEPGPFSQNRLSRRAKSRARAESA